MGHAAAVAAALIAAMALGRALSPEWLRWIVALALLVVGVDGLRRHRHVRLSGMRASARELALWSFLMASAHGAGLTVLPFVLGSEAPTMPGGLHHHHASTTAPLAAGLAGADSIALTAPLVHTAGWLAMTVVLAVVVYEKVGLRILRRAWLNVNLIWAAALVGAAAAAVLG